MEEEGHQSNQNAFIVCRVDGVRGKEEHNDKSRHCEDGREKQPGIYASGFRLFFVTDLMAGIRARVSPQDPDHCQEEDPCDN